MQIKNALQPADVSGPYRDYVLAGRWASYEYQLQLRRDVGAMTDIAAAPGCLPFWSFHIRGKTGLILLDTRFFRSFTDDLENPLTGTPQLRDVVAQLKDWSTREDIASIVVMSSIPLLFPSKVGAMIADWFEGRHGKHLPSGKSGHGLDHSFRHVVQICVL